jgi:ribosomal protein S6
VADKRETTLRAYDALFILASSLKDEAVQKAVESVKGEIARFGGVLVQGNELGKRTFARPLKDGKHGAGLYVRFSFNMAPDAVDAFRERFRHREEVVRVQIVCEGEARAASAEEKTDGLDEPRVPDGKPDARS